MTFDTLRNALNDAHANDDETLYSGVFNAYVNANAVPNANGNETLTFDNDAELNEFATIAYGLKCCIELNGRTITFY